MDSRQARELMEAMQGAGGTWRWSLHPSRDDMNGAAHTAEVFGEQAATFVFQQIVESWERDERPATVVVDVVVKRYDYPSITCPKCQRTSFNPDDVREGYCDACHEYTTPRGVR